MVGREILDVVIGLMFVYLLLSLLATALNEYISTVLNLRGKELARGLGRLLEDLDENDAVERARAGLRTRGEAAARSLTTKFYNHPLIRTLGTHGMFSGKPRLPSYIPARTFAMALLDTLEVRNPNASLNANASTADADAADGSSLSAASAEEQAARVKLSQVLEILKRESPEDVIEHLGQLSTVLADSSLPSDVRAPLANALTGAQTQLQKLHDSVEVWFNNSMDRVSGAYKRNVQAWLLAIGLVIAACTNADTIDMWRELSTNDTLREAMANRAADQLPSLEPQVRSGTVGPPQGGADSVAPGDTSTDPTSDSIDVPLDAAPPTPSDTADGDTLSDDNGTDARSPADSAWDKYLAARTQLDSMELKLGWTPHEAMRIGLIAPDSTYKGKVPAWRAPFNLPFWAKLIGVLLTALAISMGAPFWFDMLNRVISIRATGRAPDEKPKSPQGAPKRAAEDTPR